MWPRSEQELIALQHALGRRAPEPLLPLGPVDVGGCFVCFERGAAGPGTPGDRGWAAAVLRQDSNWEAVHIEGTAGSAYQPGLLALREGPLLEAAVRALSRLPHLLFVNATGRDHPRRAGLALHLGAVLGIPTVGVTDRTLYAKGPPPAGDQGSRSPLRVGGEIVGYWLRTRSSVRPVAVHAGWRTDAETAVELALGFVRGGRTPEPIARARQTARTARAQVGAWRPPS
ncbi:MAG: endonuclease V [Chloroflexi bacterium]|nr:endonuclease V [Chloroflexota bacterium]